MTNNEAIEILKPLFDQCKGANGCMGYIEHYFSKDEEKALDLAIAALEERPQGEWIYPEKTDKEKGYGGYCSNCKCDMPIFVEDWKQKYCETKFCPNCGAKMKGGKE